MKLLELFKGTGSVGKVANKMDFDVISVDVESKYEPDILTDILKWNYKDFYKKTRFLPDFIWASPPCNTYSVLAYPFKERNTKTAEPYSQRAKIGTMILYKTLEIIAFYKKLNPKLLFVIENPYGMMRLDKKINKLNIATTTYASYGDFKYKKTDFFNNLPNNLILNPIKSYQFYKDKNQVTPVDEIEPIEKRYSIPSKLIKSILVQMVQEYNI